MTAIQGILDLHNKYREQHQATPLQWNQELEKAAVENAKALIENPDAILELLKPGAHWGHNLYEYVARGQGQVSDADAVEDAIHSWYEDVANYDPASPSGSKGGSFAQLVWKSTLTVGLAIARKDDGESTNIVVLAFYDPPGNCSDKFEENVLFQNVTSLRPKTELNCNDSSAEGGDTVATNELEGQAPISDTPAEKTEPQNFTTTKTIRTSTSVNKTPIGGAGDVSIEKTVITETIVQAEIVNEPESGSTEQENSIPTVEKVVKESVERAPAGGDGEENKITTTTTTLTGTAGEGADLVSLIADLVKTATSSGNPDGTTTLSATIKGPVVEGQDLSEILKKGLAASGVQAVVTLGEPITTESGEIETTATVTIEPPLKQELGTGAGDSVESGQQNSTVEIAAVPEEPVEVAAQPPSDPISQTESSTASSMPPQTIIVPIEIESSSEVKSVAPDLKPSDPPSQDQAPVTPEVASPTESPVVIEPTGQAAVESVPQNSTEAPPAETSTQEPTGSLPEPEIKPNDPTPVTQEPLPATPSEQDPVLKSTETPQVIQTDTVANETPNNSEPVKPEPVPASPVLAEKPPQLSKPVPVQPQVEAKPTAAVVSEPKSTPIEKSQEKSVSEPAPPEPEKPLVTVLTLPRDTLDLTVQLHNDYRRKHGAPSAKIDQKLCDEAKNFAKSLLLGESVESLAEKLSVSQNIYRTNGPLDDPQEIIKTAVVEWYSRVDEYNWNSPMQATPASQSFSKVVWASSRKIGVAMATQGATAGILVILYAPNANFSAEKFFRANVRPDLS